MDCIGDTDLMEIHAVVKPGDILAKLGEHRERYLNTLDDVRTIYEAQTERYAEAYKEYTQKEINGELTEVDKRTKPQEPSMPPDRRKTYDRYLALYEATMSEMVYLGEQDFAKFFLDEWDFIVAHIRHLRVLRAGGTAAFLDSDANVMAANALMAYGS